MTSLKIATIDNIDDRLGRGSERYFASGYRRVEYSYGAVRIAAGGERLSGRLGVHVPAIWSKKGDTVQRPHLSSIDAIAIGATATEALLAHRLGLRPADLPRAWLTECKVRSGRVPAENLDNVGLSATVATNTVSDESGDEADSGPGTPFTTVSMVGGMTIRTTIRHDARPNSSHHRADADYESLADLLGHDSERHYGVGFRGFRHDIGAVTMAADRPECVARVSWGHLALPRTIRGVDSLVAPEAQPVPAFAVGLQLGQLMLYDLDDLDRASSNTLWMRRLELCIRTPPSPPLSVATQSLVTTRLAQSRVVESAEGPWRVASVQTHTPFVELRCDVSHRLPLRPPSSDSTGKETF